MIVFLCCDCYNYLVVETNYVVYVYIYWHDYRHTTRSFHIHQSSTLMNNSIINTVGIRCVSAYRGLYIDRRGLNGAMDRSPNCCTIRGAVAGFESLTIIRYPKCLVDPGFITDTWLHCHLAMRPNNNSFQMSSRRRYCTCKMCENQTGEDVCGRWTWECRDSMDDLHVHTVCI